MNNSILFPNSPILSLASLEQRQSAAPVGKKRKKTVVEKKGSVKMAHCRRRRQERKPKVDNIVTVVVNGKEHRVKLNAQPTERRLKSSADNKMKRAMRTTKRTKGSERHSQPKPVVKKSTQMKKNANYKMRSTSGVKGGMLPEERAYQLSIHPREQRNDVPPATLDRKREMLKTIERVSKRLALQEHVLPEERAYLLEIRSHASLRRCQVLKDLGAMKRRVSQGFLPVEESYHQLIDEAALLTRDG